MSFHFFQKNKPETVDLSNLGCDIHSHLIPGIDDGAGTMDDSLALINGLLSIGYRKIVTTPHILRDIYPNTREIIQTGRASVVTELKRQGMEVDFSAAAEYLMDDHFENILDSDEPLMTIKDRLVLVELSFVVAAINLKELLFKLQIKGYQPVLAHPERYLYFGANKDWYQQIRDTGCLFQLNLLSMAGYYGKTSRELAQYLIKQRFVDFLGTDLHHERHLAFLRSSPDLQAMVNRLVDTGLIRNSTL